jgi:hypothetical protein
MSLFFSSVLNVSGGEGDEGGDVGGVEGGDAAVPCSSSSCLVPAPGKNLKELRRLLAPDVVPKILDLPPQL